jgi:predicted RNA-binding protein with RPS1 domain
MPKRVRVHELAKELGLTNKEALDLCIALGIDARSHSSQIEDAQADRVRRRAQKDGLIRERQPEEAAPAKRTTKNAAVARAAAVGDRPADDGEHRIISSRQAVEPERQVARRPDDPAPDAAVVAKVAAEPPAEDAMRWRVVSKPFGTFDDEGNYLPRQVVEDDLGQSFEGTFVDVEDGQFVNGTVVKIDKDQVLLDIGYKSVGVIPLRELSIRKDVNPFDVVKMGEELEALVLTKEDREGRLLLSRKRAQYERAWGTIEKIKDSDGVVEGPVIEVVKGGLVMDVGLRGFLPASLVELRRVGDLRPYVGRVLQAKIIELDKNRNNVVLSRRGLLEGTEKQQGEERLARSGFERPVRMSDTGPEGFVFLSYARVDRAYVERLAAEANRRGIAIWFDTDIKSGEQWDEVIAG